MKTGFPEYWSFFSSPEPCSLIWLIFYAYGVYMNLLIEALVSTYYFTWGVGLWLYIVHFMGQ